MESLLIGMMVYYFFALFCLMIYMFLKRRKAIQEKKLSFGYFKDYQGDIPDNLKIIENHYNNQFQIPLLFFVACLLALQQDSVDLFVLICAGLFIISRFIHSYIHLGSNHLLKRALVFFWGVVFTFGIFLRVFYLSFI